MAVRLVNYVMLIRQLRKVKCSSEKVTQAKTFRNSIDQMRENKGKRTLTIEWIGLPMLKTLMHDPALKFQNRIVPSNEDVQTWFINDLADPE